MVDTMKCIVLDLQGGFVLVYTSLNRTHGMK